MTALKEGKVQRDMTFLFYHDQFFIEMNRKDSVNKVEQGKIIFNKEIGNLNKDINELKNKFIQTKIILVSKIETLDDVEDKVADLIQNEFKIKSINEVDEE